MANMRMVVRAIQYTTPYQSTAIVKRLRMSDQNSTEFYCFDDTIGKPSVPFISLEIIKKFKKFNYCNSLVEY